MTRSIRVRHSHSPRPTRWIRRAMVIATACWLAGMLLTATWYSSSRLYGSDMVVAPDDASSLVSPAGTRWDRRAWLRNVAIESVLAGVCFPSVPYGVVMVVLGVGLVAMRPG